MQTASDSVGFCGYSDTPYEKLDLATIWLLVPCQGSASHIPACRKWSDHKITINNKTRPEYDYRQIVSQRSIMLLCTISTSTEHKPPIVTVFWTQIYIYTIASCVLCVYLRIYVSLLKCCRLNQETGGRMFVGHSLALLLALSSVIHNNNHRL